MSEYRVGTVQVTNASSIVRADSVSPNIPAFITNVTKGDLFKKRYESVFYTVASVVNATRLQLSSKYAGTSGTGEAYIIVRDFTPNLTLPEMSSGDQDFADVYTRAVRKIDEYLPSAITAWIQDTNKHARVSATAFNASTDVTSIYMSNRMIKVRGTVVNASANYYSIVAVTPAYNATTNQTLVRTDSTVLSATPIRYYYAAALNVLTDQIKDTHIDFGTGSTQVNASDIPILDYQNVITASRVEGVLYELKQDFLSVGNLTATVTRFWVTTASCFRASNDVFNASGNKVTTFPKNIYVKMVDSTSSYYSYVSTIPVYNSTTVKTKVTLASQAIPATPTTWYRDSGNTVTSFKLKSIAQYPNDFFNTHYYANITTGSNIDLVKQISDWVATSCLITTAAFTYIPRYGTQVEIYRKPVSIVAANSTVTVAASGVNYSVAVTDPLVIGGAAITATGGFKVSLVASKALRDDATGKMIRIVDYTQPATPVSYYTKVWLKV